MKTNVEISNYLRYVADLYFARFVVSRDKSLQVRGFAFAKAADAIAGGQVSAEGKIAGVGESVSTVIREFTLTGKCSRVAGLQGDFALPDGLRSMTSLPGLTEPFLFSLAFTYGVKTKEELSAALPRIKADNERVALRVYEALLVDAQRQTAENHALTDKLVDAGKSEQPSPDIAQKTINAVMADRENKP